MNHLRAFNFHSPDITDLASFSPTDNTDIYFPLEFEVGLEGGDARSLFSVMVATPQSLKAHGRIPRAEHTKYLIVHHYSWAEIQSRIHNILRTTPCTAEDVTPLLCFFNWEYEGYR